MVFKNKKDKFAVLLGNIAGNLRESTNYFADYKLNNESDLKIFAQKMKEYETKGDNFVHEMILELNDAFITPIEREDLLALTNSLDDVLDGIEQCAGLFDMYSITHADEYMLKFVDAIRNAVIEIEKAIELLFNKKLPAMREHSIKIKAYESDCDEVLRESIKNLFTTEKDPIRLIKYKDIYDDLEEIADNCQTVANTLETIIMKNA
jgi:predicted phosphate transport protein (TIGR00153 family)